MGLRRERVCLRSHPMEPPVILIGQYDSSFVRRIAIALTIYGVPFEHKPWSIFGDVDKIRPLNPLIRVPALVLEDGTVLVETLAILDYVDHLAPDGAVLLPREEPARHRALRICALASGLGDLFASLFYEKQLHRETSDFLVARRLDQIGATLGVLEMERARVKSIFWLGETPGHADIAVATALAHLNGAHPGLFDMAGYPALRSHCEICEALPVFRAIHQPFVPPA